MMNLKNKLQTVQENIATACSRSGRSPSDVTLVVVTKSVQIDVIRDLLELGVSDIAENRVQHAEAKFAELGPQPGVRYHMIGHLQRNKAKKAVELFNFIHSIDSLRLAKAVSKAATNLGKEIPGLLEVNVSGEESKYGFTAESARRAAAEIAALPGLKLQGLMTMAPFDADERALHEVFDGLRNLGEQIAAETGTSMPHLSMGMSQDYEVAVEEGATLVRVGSAIVA